MSANTDTTYSYGPTYQANYQPSTATNRASASENPPSTSIDQSSTSAYPPSTSTNSGSSSEHPPSTSTSTTSNMPTAIPFKGRKISFLV